MFGRKKKTRPGKSLMAFAWYTGGSMSIPVTKFSLRLYGSAKAVEQEQRRHESAGSCVIHPYSNFRFYWDFVSLILLILTMLTVPVAISFFNEEMTSDPGWIAANLALDMWFFCDIIINFHTGIFEKYGDSEVILDLKIIRKRYLKSWFVIDLISTIPLDYILQMFQLANGVSRTAIASRAMKLFRFAKLLSLLRLLRISRLIRYVHQWEEIVNVQYDFAVAAVRIFNLVCLMLLIGHWNGCLQFLVPMLYDFPENSWVVIDNLKGASWGEQYSWALFKAMSHMLCIGYGQRAPQNLMDLWMTMISMVSGAVCFAMFIGHTTALIQSLDSSKRQYKEKYMQVKEYMRYRHLPKDLRLRIHEYYENRFQGKMFDEEGILNEISRNLREEVVNYNCRHLVASVPFFRNANVEFVTEVVQKLKYEVFQPNDIVLKENTYGKKMYFIQHGVVQIYGSKSEQRTELTDGSYFGEICLLTNKKRIASVKALTNCCLYSLHVDDFNHIVEEYPVMRRTLETVAAARLNKMGRHNSVLERRIKQTNLHDTTSSGLAEEIVKHDEKVFETRMNEYNKSTTASKIFGEGSMSGIKKYGHVSSSRAFWGEYDKGIPFGSPKRNSEEIFSRLGITNTCKKGSYSMSDIKNHQGGKVMKKRFIGFLRKRKSQPNQDSLFEVESKTQISNLESSAVVQDEPTTSLLDNSASAPCAEFISRFGRFSDCRVKEASVVSKAQPCNPRSSPDGENSTDAKINAMRSRKFSSNKQRAIFNSIEEDDSDVPNNDPKRELLPKNKSSLTLPSENESGDFVFHSSDRIEVLVEDNQAMECDEQTESAGLHAGDTLHPKTRHSTINGDACNLNTKTKTDKWLSAPDVRVWVAPPCYETPPFLQTRLSLVTDPKHPPKSF